MLSVLVALAGGLGAATRFALDGSLSVRPRRLPVATLTINVLGSFLLGLLAGAAGVPGDVRHVLGVGFLGGFTTFSTASVELVRLVRDERPVGAVVLGVGMLAMAVAAAVAGQALGRPLAWG